MPATGTRTSSSLTFGSTRRCRHRRRRCARGCGHGGRGSGGRAATAVDSSSSPWSLLLALLLVALAALVVLAWLPWFGPGCRPPWCAGRPGHPGCGLVAGRRFCPILPPLVARLPVALAARPPADGLARCWRVDAAGARCAAGASLAGRALRRTRRVAASVAGSAAVGALARRSCVVAGVGRAARGAGAVRAAAGAVARPERCAGLRPAWIAAISSLLRSLRGAGDAQLAGELCSSGSSMAVSEARLRGRPSRRWRRTRRLRACPAARARVCRRRRVSCSWCRSRDESVLPVRSGSTRLRRPIAADGCAGPSRVLRGVAVSSSPVQVRVHALRGQGCPELLAPGRTRRPGRVSAALAALVTLRSRESARNSPADAGIANTRSVDAAAHHSNTGPPACSECDRRQRPLPTGDERRRRPGRPRAARSASPRRQRRPPADRRRSVGQHEHGRTGAGDHRRRCRPPAAAATSAAVRGHRRRPVRLVQAVLGGRQQQLRSRRSARRPAARPGRR